jgi:MFS family permease
VPVSSIGLLITAYFVTLAVLIPSSGWLVSRWGTRKVFLSAIVVFTVAPVIAPLAGGVITTYGSWRWIFLINVPLGVVAFAVAVRSPVKSGAVVLFVFVGNIGIKPATSFIVGRWGFRRVLLAACLTLSVSMVGAAFFTSGTPIALIALTAVVSGIGRSVGGTSYNTLSYVDVPEATVPHANTLVATTQQLAAGLGVAAATLALRFGGTLDGHPGSETAQVSYSIAFGCLALLPLAAMLGVSRLRRDGGDVARRRPAERQAPAELDDVVG